MYWGLKNWTTELGPEATEVIMRHVELCQVKNISARIDKICIERFETQILLPSQEHQKNLHSKKFQSILVCQNEFFCIGVKDEPIFTSVVQEA